MKILLVDDHVLFTEGLAAVLNARLPGCSVTASVSPEAALARKDLAEFDLCITDFYMPTMHGLEFIHRLSKRSASPNILLVSSSDQLNDVKAALEAGATGFVDKGSDVDTIVVAIKNVVRGVRFLPVKYRSALRDIEEGQVLKLTRKQQETLMYVAAGLNNRTIAERMSIAEVTVKSHVSDLLRIFDVSNRTECVAEARKLGMVL